MRRRSTLSIILVLSMIALSLLSSYLPKDSCTGTKETALISASPKASPKATPNSEPADVDIDLKNNYFFDFPTYAGEEVIQLNNNNPCVEESDLSTDEYVLLSDLDSLGRCGPATACIGPQLLATEPRGSIGMIKPSGWHTIRYDFVDGKYLYNRCHLIAYQLCGINSDERNLITGTRYLNLDGMLAIENQVYSYVVSTGNHVFYRVTPRFSGNNLLATGVEIEAYSIEDYGNGLCFHVFCFNVQPGITIDYQTGESNAEETITRSNNEDESSDFIPSEGVTFILNTNTKRFHKPTCNSVQEMKAKNRKEFFGTRDELIEQGYIPCGRCNP